MMEIKISVRNLVEFLFRSGDITEGGEGSISKEAMNEGSRIHRKLQRQAKGDYNAEVPLKYSLQNENYNILIDGRADGIINKNGNYTIDEIKGMYKNLSDLTEPVRVHEAQAKCYAYIYASENDLPEIEVQMTYVNLETEAIKRFNKLYSFPELSKWFNGMMAELILWLDLKSCHNIRRNASITDMEFPFEYRKGQKDMAACVYRAIANGKHLYVQAPTGIGKTLGALFPAVKSVEQGLSTKIFYLTAKTIAGTVARNTITVLKEKGLVFKTISITAKEKICPLDEMNCNPLICPYAKGHYDRINEALFDMISHEEAIDREIAVYYGERYKVCPFELTLDASLYADCIICDYNYVFDPRVNLKRFFGQGAVDKGKYVFLTDESHNLVDRASSMYSAVLVKEEILAAKRLVKKYSAKTAAVLENCNRGMLELKKQLGDRNYMLLDGIGTFHFKLLNAFSAMEAFVEEHKNISERKEIMEFYFKLNTFLNIAELVDENYIIYAEQTSSGTFMLKLFCVLPAANLQKCLEKGVATIFFSATLLPVNYYKEMLSGDAGCDAIYIPSPFDRKNRAILVGRDVTTRYSRRGDNEYYRIYEYIKAMVYAKQGNYMVFFPSYKMMNDVYDIAVGDGLCNDRALIIQNSGMNEEEREKFLKHFSESDRVVAFCIMGGIFSEGIDLDGDKLVGAAVVGPGLPQVCTERQLRMDFFDKRQGNGFKYAYVYPGINKVLQAAGRVIRTEEDKGVIMLLDERFAKAEYKVLYPEEWSDYRLCNINQAAGILSDFWNLLKPM